MVQTRGQQMGDQSPLSHGALRGVTDEGDAASTAVASGNTLKHAVSAHTAEHSGAVLAGGGSGRDGPVSPLGAGSPTTISVSIPMGIRRRFTGWKRHPDDRQTKGDQRLLWYRRSGRWFGQHWPPRSIYTVCRHTETRSVNQSYTGIRAVVL